MIIKSASHKYLFRQRTHCFSKSIFPNGDSINRLFMAHKLDRQLINQQNIRNVNIYQCSYTTHVLFVISRYQILAYCILGQLYYFYVTNTKINKIEDRKQELNQILENEKEEQVQQQLQSRVEKLKDRKRKLIYANMVSIVVSMAACYFTYRFSKIIIRSIDFIPQQRSLQINYYGLLCFKKPRLVKLQDISPIQSNHSLSKFSIRKTYQYQYNDNGTEWVLATKGTGSWIQKDIVDKLQQVYDD